MNGILQYDVDHALVYSESPAHPLGHRCGPKAWTLTPDQQRHNRELLLLAHPTTQPRAIENKTEAG